MKELKSFIEGTAIPVGRGRVYVNPGTGPIEEATEENAAANIRPLLMDAGLDPDAVVVKRKPKRDVAGRFCFVLRLDKRKVTVDMPGLPLEQVRYLGQGEQNIWDFPRLYVDGDSWVWLFAKDWVRRALSEVNHERENV